MCGRIIQASSPLQLAIVDGLDVRPDSRGNHAPRYNGAPGQEHLLYVNPDMPWQSSIRDHHHPDYDRYPLFREAKCQKVVVHAGETLFLPCGWWHTARGLNMTISVAFDSLGPDNWSDFVGDVVEERRRNRKPLKALALGTWLRAIGPLLTLQELGGANRGTRWGAR